MDNQSINLTQIFSIMKKHLTLITCLSVIGATIFGCLTVWAIAPKYESSSLILVNRKQDTDANAQYAQVQTDLQMVNTYKDIISQGIILDTASKNLIKDGFPTNINLANAITITNNENSQVLKITAKANSPYLAKDIVNEVISVFQTKITHIMSNARNVSIISKGTVERKPVSPNLKLNVLIGLVIGLFLGILFAFFKELTDRTVKSEDFLTDTLGIPLMGTISDMKDKQMQFGKVRPSKVISRRSRTVN
ncbi:YveK family protein [Lacticaseibacillus paracasei]|uniref:YveK family protein n=1 Tax=Lacticaseibacillus paracasei TaxID=1597 RepID=UPI000F43E129|nr:Wzz/FepE/Etk N-terminal domain-containing protein [Lacticaseibacillus paracasei]RND50206.1 Capsular polysaccharide type 8 biosynthesis protein cap8A [Lacticaseibacillus paracasei]